MQFCIYIALISQCLNISNKTADTLSLFAKVNNLSDNIFSKYHTFVYLSDQRSNQALKKLLTMTLHRKKPECKPRQLTGTLIVVYSNSRSVLNHHKPFEHLILITDSNPTFLVRYRLRSVPNISVRCGAFTAWYDGQQQVQPPEYLDIHSVNK